MDLGFVWDENKYRRVQEQHGVRFDEVVAVFEDEHGYEAQDPAGHDDRYLVVGATRADRVLMVIFSEAELPLYRIITAFDAEGSWRDEYQQGRRGL